MSKALNNRLTIVWNETTFQIGTAGATPRRFIAKAFDYNSMGWGVFDRKKRKFLSDEQVCKLSIAALRETMEH